MVRVLPSLALAGLLALCACKGQPLPPDKLDFAGHWRGGGIDLVITPDGGVAYDKVTGSGHVEINGSIQGWEDGDFLVGVAVFKTTFDIGEPPHEVDGVWKMTVDGVELTRVAE